MNEENVLTRLCATVRKAHTAIVLTHNIDFLFVETVVLPRLRTIGSPQLTIFADAACAAGTFHSQEKFVSKLGTRYRVVPVDLGGARRFHPKALFIAGTEDASLAVGSGNTTYGGWSANKEIWTDFSLPGNGGAEIASFRDYLTTILARIPDAAAIRAGVREIFDSPENSWTQALLQPAGLAWTPSTTPMMEQVLAQVGEPISRIDVLSPYFDPDGAALSKIARHAVSSVHVMLQPNKAGMSKDIAADLPENVRLHGVDIIGSDNHSKFIHAKAYLFETGIGSFIAAGSANCSRAALLADESWGNAEIMAISPLTADDVDAFWTSLVITDEPPELPEVHPSEEWSFEASDLRVVAARKDAAKLTVHFKTDIELVDISIHSVDLHPLRAHAISADRAAFLIDQLVKSAKLVGVAIDGRTYTSLPFWIDDERSLGMPHAERMLREKLEEVATRGSLIGREFVQLLELFEFHVQHDALHVGEKRIHRTDASPPIYLSDADIYSDEFGKPSCESHSVHSADFSEIDEINLIYSFFRTPFEGKFSSFHDKQPSADNDIGEDDSPQTLDHETNDAKAIELYRKHFARMLSKIESSMQRPDYLRRRKPERVAADIAFLAVLMAKARADGILDKDAYRSQSMRFWCTLFVGSKGVEGLIPRFLMGMDEETRSSFTSDMRSPRLSAAMALWCTFDWVGAEAQARDFRFSAGLLAAQHKWLAEGGDPAAIIEELQCLAEKLFPAAHREPLLEAWIRWVRDGHALAAIYDALNAQSQPDLAKLVTRPMIKAKELTWHKACGLCVLENDIAPLMNGKAHLRPVDGSESITIKAAFVAPLTDILKSDIDISMDVRRHVFDLFIGERLD